GALGTGVEAGHHLVQVGDDGVGTDQPLHAIVVALALEARREHRARGREKDEKWSSHAPNIIPVMNLYIVTGVRRGLGEALARRIAASKDNELIGISRPEVDLADSAAIARALEDIGRRISGKRYAKAVLINNAGVIEPVAPLDRADPAEIERNLGVNLVAPMLLMRHFL